MNDKLISQDRLSNLIYRMKEEPKTLAFFLGAGVSRSSGIPLASEIVESIKLQKAKDLRQIEPDLSDVALEGFFKTQGLFENIHHNYSDAIRLAYPTRQDRQKFFQSLYIGKNPSPGHRYLAEIVRRGFVDTIFTTNFDPLMENALRETDVLYKLVSHDELGRYAEIRGDLVNLIKLHGDYLYSNLKNLEEETKKLSKGLNELFSNFLGQYGLVVVGFGGNDESIMFPLRQIKEPYFLSRGLYWVYKNSNKTDLMENPLFVEISKRSSGNLVLIGVDSADEFLKIIHTELLNPVTSLSPTLVDLNIHNYTMRQLIGKGEFGSVYKCEHIPFGGEKAVKLIDSNAIVQKIYENAKLISLLGKHPNILDIEDCGIDNGRGYLISEYIEYNLSHFSLEIFKLTHHSKETESEDLQRILAVIEIGCQILRALQYSHEMGIVHGNLKPTNILLDRNGQIRISDFIVSSIALEIKGKVFFTSTTSLPFIAPEQREGNRPTVQTDLYAMCAILYKILTGRLHSDELISPSDLNPSIPIALSEIIWKGLKADLLTRYQSAKDLILAFEDFQRVFKESQNINRREFFRDTIETHVAGICLRDNAGVIEVLLARRSPSKQIYPNLWDGGGGAVRSGENFEEALVRELSQELGVIVKPLLPLRVYEIQINNNRQKKIPGIVFVCEALDYVIGNQPHVDGTDMVEWKWFPVLSLEENNLIPGVAEDIRLAQKAYLLFLSRTRSEDERLEVHVSGVCLRLSNGELEVLLCKRTNTRTIFPGVWETGGGGVNAGETFEDALIREFEEELRITVEPIKVVGTYFIEVSNVVQPRIPGVVFLCRVSKYLSGSDPVIDKKEHDEYRWQSVEKLHELEIIPNAIFDITQAVKDFYQLGLAS